MGFNPQHLRASGFAYGRVDDPPATDPDAPATIISLLKGILLALPAIAPDPPQPRPRRGLRVQDPTYAIGAPEDPIATDTTDLWSQVSLLKGILDRLQGL